MGKRIDTLVLMAWRWISEKYNRSQKSDSCSIAAGSTEDRRMAPNIMGESI